jgi:hypothetical protein
MTPTLEEAMGRNFVLLLILAGAADAFLAGAGPAGHMPASRAVPLPWAASRAKRPRLSMHTGPGEEEEHEHTVTKITLGEHLGLDRRKVLASSLIAFPVGDGPRE